MSFDNLTDPPRFADGESEATRALLRVTRDDAPSALVMERMAKRLAAAGALSSPGAAVHRPRSEARVLGTKLGAVLAVAGSLLVGWHASELVSSGDGGRAVALEAAEVVTPATTTASIAIATPTGAPAALEHAEPVAVATVPIGDLPSASSAAPRPRPIRIAAEDTRAGANVEAPSELELLQRARVALRSDPRRALELATEQARAYPSGEFVQEREVIAVEALARLGRPDEARERARAVVAQFPRTPYVDRLELAVGRPL